MAGPLCLFLLLAGCAGSSPVEDDDDAWTCVESHAVAADLPISTGRVQSWTIETDPDGTLRAHYGHIHTIEVRAVFEELPCARKDLEPYPGGCIEVSSGGGSHVSSATARIYRPGIAISVRSESTADGLVEAPAEADVAALAERVAATARRRSAEVSACRGEHYWWGARVVRDRCFAPDECVVTWTAPCCESPVCLSEPEPLAKEAWHRRQRACEDRTCGWEEESCGMPNEVGICDDTHCRTRSTSKPAL